MSLQKEVMAQMVTAMKSKDKVALESLRALKSAFLLANTSGNKSDLNEEDEIKIVQKLIKQRKRVLLNKFKRSHFRAELENWLGFCSPDDTEEEEDD